MCDVLMLACWVWAVAFWVEGLDQNRAIKIFAAGLLVALAVVFGSTALVGGALFFGEVWHKYPGLQGSARWPVAAQFILWMSELK